MPSDFTYIFINIFSIIILIIFMFISFKHIKKQAGFELMLIIAFATLWSFGSFFELQIYSFESKLFWRNITQISVFMIPLMTYSFVSTYIGDRGLKYKFIISLIYIIQIAGIILILTDETHHLMRKSVGLIVSGGVLSIAVEQTLLGKVLISFNFILMILSEIKLTIFMLKNPKNVRKQIISIILGVAFPIIFGLIKVTFLESLIPRIPISVAFIPGSLLVLWGIIKCDVLAITPIARDKVFDIINEGIIVFSNEGKIVDLNIPAKAFINAVFNSEKGPYQNCILESSYEEFKEAVLNFKEVSIDFSYLYRDKERYCNIDIYPLNQKLLSNSGVIAVVRDITEEKEQKELLRIQAETDGLTKILNRSSFVKYVEEELLLEDEDKKFATMLVIDVDYFKKVNDTYGHAAGDYVLIESIEIIKTIIQETCLIGRLGGEEFGIFTTQYNENQAKELAEVIRQRIGEYPFDFKGNSISVTLSVGGVSVRNENARQFDTLFALADSALYEAKNEGRNRVNFYSKSR